MPVVDPYTRLKFRLLAEGAVMAPDFVSSTKGWAKPALRVRSGSCGGVDLILPDGTHVNCPVNEPFARRSSLTLGLVDGKPSVMIDGDAVTVDLVPAPAYYSRADSAGRPFTRTGQVCFDRLGIGLTNNCLYWRDPASRCKFCSIGLNTRTEDVRKELSAIAEMARAAFADEIYPASHTLIGGGTLDVPDRGIGRIADITRVLKSIDPAPVYAMITPPSDLDLLDELVAAGVDEIGINVELIDEQAAQRLLGAKRSEHGLEGYRCALTRAVELFGPMAARSILIVGLEPPERTLEGVELLSAMGVMPILSPFRPLIGTELESHPPPTAELLLDVAIEATGIAATNGIPLGPTCMACQGNTLNLPGDPAYHRYTTTSPAAAADQRTPDQ